MIPENAERAFVVLSVYIALAKMAPSSKDLKTNTREKINN